MARGRKRKSKAARRAALRDAGKAAGKSAGKAAGNWIEKLGGKGGIFRTMLAWYLLSPLLKWGEQQLLYGGTSPEVQLAREQAKLSREAASAERSAATQLRREEQAKAVKAALLALKERSAAAGAAAREKGAAVAAAGVQAGATEPGARSARLMGGGNLASPITANQVLGLSIL